MCDVSEAVRNRRSIRKYTVKPVPAEFIHEILEAATWAPSAHNAQPWRFIVLAETEAKRKLALAMAEAWLLDLESNGETQKESRALADASVQRLTDAPVLILSCLTLKDMIHFPDEERQKSERDLAVQSLSAAIQNMLLMAHAKGLGACWYCTPVFCKTEVRHALGLPDDVEPQALITVGYPAEKPRALQRKPIRSVAFKESWGKKL